MSAARGRLRHLFVAPVDGVAITPRPAEVATAVRQRSAPSALSVLCAPREAEIAATAVALAAAAALGVGSAVVCRWTGVETTDVMEPDGAGLVLPATRRLAERLTGRGLVVAPRGRIVDVTLPADGPGARAGVARLAAVADGLPLVVVIAGPRPEDLDGLLVVQDRVIVVPPGDAAEGIEELAVRDAARVGRAIGVLQLSASPTARLAARLGLTLPPSLRRAAVRALGGPGA